MNGLVTFFVSLAINLVLPLSYGWLIYLIFGEFGLSRELGIQEPSFFACYLISLLVGAHALLFNTKVKQEQ
jgi:hypothetical protein